MLRNKIEKKTLQNTSKSTKITIKIIRIKIKINTNK
jgi:hypothetical protein